MSLIRNMSLRWSCQHAELDVELVVHVIWHSTKRWLCLALWPLQKGDLCSSQASQECFLCQELKYQFLASDDVVKAFYAQSRSLSCHLDKKS